MESFTEKLPLQIRASMARHWLMGIALEKSLEQQPKDELPEQLWEPQDLITEDMADIGLDAFMTLDYDLGQMLIQEVADACWICSGCLGRAIFGTEDEEEV